jgi:hypothetical protein
VKKLASLLILALMVAGLALSTTGNAEAGGRYNKSVVLPQAACDHIPGYLLKRILPECDASGGG